MAKNSLFTTHKGFKYANCQVLDTTFTYLITKQHQMIRANIKTVHGVV